MNSRLLTRFSKPEKPSTNYGKETIRTMQLNVRAEVKDFQLHSAHDLFLSAQNPKLTENEPKYRFSFENRFLINYHNKLVLKISQLNHSMYSTPKISFVLH